jgi:catechol 2,3-dioxygenase-like lactoylglutathione lyase family enzyme
VNLGAFSLSLSVKDIAASQAFYEKLGFTVMGGDREQGWLILKSPTCVLGLFQGMFDRNMLTFNPGWDSGAQPLEEFTDVREIQKALKAAGVAIDSEADENTTGPASFMITDPDGNPVLIDQHR